MPVRICRQWIVIWFACLRLELAAAFVLVAVNSHSCPSWRFQRLSLVGQLGFFDRGNVDIVVVEESQQFIDFSADSVRVPLHSVVDS